MFGTDSGNLLQLHDEIYSCKRDAGKNGTQY